MRFTATVSEAKARVSAQKRGLATAGRRGLTLIELVIVIAILTVLGGLVVRTLPNLLKRTHLSKCSDTISALNKTWGESFALNTKYPDRYDSLLVTDGSTFPHLPTGLAALITPTTLEPAEANALASLGVRYVVDLDDTATNVTYDAAPLDATRRLISAGPVATLPSPGTSTSAIWNANPLRLKRHLSTTEVANTDTVKYVVFGVGSNCTAIGAGKLLQEAPVHFGADDTINPTTVYQRYLAIFSVSTTAAGAVSAHFEAMSGNDTDGPSSAEDHIRQYYSGQAKEE